ncbi:hypothetical protein ASH00_14705 [Arthrobacter sp. Soil782]|uniref:HAD domain-containing protein n=1 Tax=Arthrobacter sp. Soil782 TaxID=1736410 RepID=UPI0006F3C2E6|nr:HAD domain-containing protein [Arthrobacter sp. Soil782]KRF04351.1 hypothetical protein ASH00_14705 [Arthrobacter sp. Soil782]
MTRTLVLIDIDGVLVPMRHRKVVPAPDEVNHQIAIPPLVPRSVDIRPLAIEAVNRWAASGADVQWLTSWGWRSKWLDQAGLPELPVFYDPDPYEVYGWGRSQRSWKKPAVEQFLESQSEPIRLAWVDDDAFFFRAAEARVQLLARHACLSDLLLVETDGYIGLTDAEIRRIDRFLAT